MIRPENYKISTNFRFYEVYRSDVADRLNIDNVSSITEEMLDSASFVAEQILEPVRRWIRRPITPNSWYRCEILEYFLCCKSFYRKLYEKGIDGVDEHTYLLYPSLDLMPAQFEDEWREYFSSKQHPKCEAVDFEVSGLSNLDLFDWCMDNIRFDQLILEFYRKEKGPNSGWVHGSTKRKGANRGQLIRY